MIKLLEFFEQLFQPLINSFLSFFNFIITIPDLIISVIRVLLHFGNFVSSFYTNMRNAISFIISGYDVIYTVLNYMPAPIMTLVYFGLGIFAVRVILDLL